MLLVLLCASALVLSSCGGSSSAAGGACAQTPRASHSPTPYLANLSHSWWERDRIWMGVAGAFHGQGFVALPKGQKIGWYRDRPGTIRLSARRLDGHSGTFSSDVPSGYGPIGFQASGVKFSAPGCWQLTATVGKRASTFVVRVAPAS